MGCHAIAIMLVLVPIVFLAFTLLFSACRLSSRYRAEGPGSHALLIFAEIIMPLEERDRGANGVRDAVN